MSRDQLVGVLTAVALLAIGLLSNHHLLSPEDRDVLLAAIGAGHLGYQVTPSRAVDPSPAYDDEAPVQLAP